MKKCKHDFQDCNEYNGDQRQCCTLCELALSIVEVKTHNYIELLADFKAEVEREKIKNMYKEIYTNYSYEQLEAEIKKYNLE